MGFDGRLVSADYVNSFRLGHPFASLGFLGAFDSSFRALAFSERVVEVFGRGIGVRVLQHRFLGRVAELLA